MFFIISYNLLYFQWRIVERVGGEGWNGIEDNVFFYSSFSGDYDC